MLPPQFKSKKLIKIILSLLLNIITTNLEHLANILEPFWLPPNVLMRDLT
jgi:hypothetical protein